VELLRRILSGLIVENWHSTVDKDLSNTDSYVVKNEQRIVVQMVWILKCLNKDTKRFASGESSDLTSQGIKTYAYSFASL
jgi:hypothetical protein